jgi:hypothetical protein
MKYQFKNVRGLKKTKPEEVINLRPTKTTVYFIFLMAGTSH